MKRIQTKSGLLKEIRRITNNHPDAQILFRGQRQLYDSVRSGRGRPNYILSPLVESGWAAFAKKLLRLDNSKPGLEQAIMQHYGYETFFVDFSDDPIVAAWFASHDYTSERKIYIGNQFRILNLAKYSRVSEGLGYFMVFAITEIEEMKARGRLIDLSMLDPSFVRPIRQSGWLLLDRPPTLPVPDDFLVETFELDLNNLDFSLERSLFPLEGDDPAYARMREFPYVQFDTYSPTKKNKEERRTTCAISILNLPEYEVGSNHKWNDVTLFEPLPMREWRAWRANLKDTVGGLDADIKDTTKISISPSALEVLSGESELRLEWPQVENDGIFVTYAQLDHDKLIDHGPLYHGAWLQKCDNLIVETPMESDEKKLSVMPGHVYFFSNSELTRQEMEKSCNCGVPETHDERVKQVLRIQTLVERGDLILLPHPCHPERWFLLLSGTERDFMSEDLLITEAKHKHIMNTLRQIGFSIF